MRSLAGMVDRIPNKYGFSHGLVALLVTAPAGLIGWHWWAACAVSAFYFGREHTQHDDKLNPFAWSLDGLWDFLVPLVVSVCIAWLWATAS